MSAIEVRGIFEGFDDEGFVRSKFVPHVRVTRGLFECSDCGAKQADYALPGVDGVECRNCAHCGGAIHNLIQLVGRVDSGPEIDLVPIYERDVHPLVLEALGRLP